MLKDNAGKFQTGTVDKYIYFFLMIVVLFKVVAQLLPEAQTAGDELANTSAPLASFFAGDGIIFLIIMVGLVVLVIRSATGSKK
ncbi:MAG: hypothetical protein ACTSR1_00585 [Candidatus Heimdallarchaeota archaeon]